MRILELLAVVRVREFLGVGELLTGMSTLFARGTSVIVITATARAEWVAALEDVAFRGLRSAVVLLEASTFGSARPSLLAVGALAAASVPTYLLKHGEPLGEALAQPRTTVEAETQVAL
jgi:hypothetical protein